MKLSTRLLVLCFLPACGGSATTDVDGAVGDGTRPLDAPTSAVTIHVFDGAHMPVVGRAVAFLKSDDSVVAEVMTDSTGTASAPMPDGGSVTVAGTGVVAGATVYTYLGVKNGDELTIGQPQPASSTPFKITVTVPANVEPTAHNFLFHSTCNVNAGNETDQRTVSMMITGGCTIADFFVEAQDASYKALSTTWRTAQPVSAGGNVDAGSAFTPLTSSTLYLSNAPQFAAVTPALDLVVGSFYPVSSPFNSSITLTNGAGTKKLTHASIPGSSLEWRIQVENLGEQFWIKRTPANALVSFDFSTANLPAISNGVAYSPTNSSVTWQESGHPTDTAAADLRIKNGTARDYDWLIVGPHTGTSLHVPHLPSSLAPFNVASGDTTTATASIGSFPGGYARIAPHVFVAGFHFFESAYALDRRDVFNYVLADGDLAMFATNR